MRPRNDPWRSRPRYADELHALAEHVGIVVREADPRAQPLPVTAALARDEEDDTACLRVSGEMLGDRRELQRLLRSEVARQSASCTPT